MAKCFKHRDREAVFKWRVCADGPWRGVCTECDIKLNELGLRWAFPRSWQKKLAAYIKQVNKERSRT